MTGDAPAVAPAPASERNVKIGELVPYARKHCEWCCGTGAHTTSAGSKLCNCVLPRFLKRHRDKVRLRAQDGALVWRD